MNMRRPARDIAWPEAFAAWVERLPIPAWSFYLLLGLVGIAYTVATDVAQGVGYSSVQFVAAAFGPYLLGVRHYLTDAALRSARRFRPLLAVNDDEFARIERRLTTTSARATWIATALGAAAGIAVGVATYTAFAPVIRASGMTTDQYLATSPFLVIAYAVAVPFLLRTYRQLQVIQQLHASAVDIDPLRPGAVSAFSTLTLRTSLTIMLPVFGEYANSLDVAASVPLTLIPIVSGNLVAIAIFVIPLLGLHARLEASRSAQLDVVGQRLRTVVAELAGRVERGELGEVAPLQQAITGLTLTRDVLLRVQTWPWQPGTFTTFVSVVGGPIVIYLLTRVLARYL